MVSKFHETKELSLGTRFLSLKCQQLISCNEWCEKSQLIEEKVVEDHPQ
jgi:hypothetical protein